MTNRWSAVSRSERYRKRLQESGGDASGIGERRCAFEAHHLGCASAICLQARMPLANMLPHHHWPAQTRTTHCRTLLIQSRSRCGSLVCTHSTAAAPAAPAVRVHPHWVRGSQGLPGCFGPVGLSQTGSRLSSCLGMHFRQCCCAILLSSAPGGDSSLLPPGRNKSR